MRIKIKARLKDLSEGMPKAYERFARNAGLYVDENTKFRCTQIEVSKEIDDYFWKYYEDMIHEEYPNMNEKEIKTQIAMLMLQNGAHRNEELEPWEVIVTEDFAENDDYIED